MKQAQAEAAQREQQMQETGAMLEQQKVTRGMVTDAEKMDVERAKAGVTQPAREGTMTDAV